MNCEKCGNPMYHPSPNKLCPKCQSEALDEWIKKQEVEKRPPAPVINGRGEKGLP